MSNDLIRAGQKYVATSDSFTKDAGGALVKTGVGAGALYLTAGVLPLITFPMLLVLAVIVGGFLYVKD